jgi:hypothetical protein
MSVGNKHPPQPVNSQATGAIDIQGRHVPVAQVFTISIKDLNPVSQVGDKEIVISVKCGHTRL